MKKATIVILALLIVGVVAAGAVSAVSFGKLGGNKQAVRDAIEAGDFAAWKSAMTGSLTEERFNQMVEIHESRGEHNCEMRGAERVQNKEAMTAIFEAEDFDAWKALMESRKNAPDFDLTEANFNKMMEMHNAMQDGDAETASRLRAELGLGQGKGFGKEGRGLHSGFEGAGTHGSCDGNCGGCPYAKK